MPTMIDSEDRYAIEQTLYQYAWMVDEREWFLMDQIFTPDATIDYTSAGGLYGPYRETLKWLDRALAEWPVNLHTLGNIAYLPDEGGIKTRCHFIAPLAKKPADGQQAVVTNAGYYFDRWVQCDGHWKIRERICQQTVMIGQLPEGYRIPT